MNNVVFIQIISIILSFACGALLVWLYGRHARPQAIAPHVSYATPPQNSALVMPEEVKNHLLDETKHDYEAALGKSAEQFSHDLTSTSDKINTQIKDLSANVIANELEEYRNGLIELRQQAITGMGEVQATVQKQRTEMQAQLEAEIEAEKQRRLSQIDTKLGEAVGAFLLEALQHNVDLGAQGPYLMAVLEEHKEELKQEVSHDV